MLRRTDGNNNTVYVDKRNKELYTSIGPYGPCGRKPMSCTSINERTFRRFGEEHIVKARMKQCQSRNSHPFYKCVTDLDSDGNFIRCRDKLKQKLPDSIPISHKLPSNQGSKHSAPISKSPNKTSRTKSPVTTSQIKSNIVQRSSKQYLSNDFMSPPDDDIYQKMYVNPNSDDSFFEAIKYYLYSIGIENHPLLKDPDEIKRESRMMKKELTERNIDIIARMYDVCIYLWNYDFNFEVNSWQVFNDNVDCVFKIMLFKEKNMYGYFVKKKSKPQQSSKKSTSQQSSKKSTSQQSSKKSTSQQSSKKSTPQQSSKKSTPAKKVQQAVAPRRSMRLLNKAKQS
jgi:hypothetical protein